MYVPCRHRKHDGRAPRVGLVDGPPSVPPPLIWESWQEIFDSSAVRMMSSFKPRLGMREASNVIGQNNDGTAGPETIVPDLISKGLDVLLDRPHGLRLEPRRSEGSGKSLQEIKRLCFHDRV